ncbi:hypothetical protein XU18_1247 [Perkinsela sp. CCAP 1560/4]|nr:hypothetical protein XU18_1247 [Perkinsela sp. CCAP 1560/4]|eukprot:KNH08239.1 hypothetical protein XU18_1247 [Perkinsela sp. CCAP 1560/4]
MGRFRKPRNIARGILGPPGGETGERPLILCGLKHGMELAQTNRHKNRVHVHWPSLADSNSLLCKFGARGNSMFFNGYSFFEFLEKIGGAPAEKLLPAKQNGAKHR